MGTGRNLLDKIRLHYTDIHVIYRDVPMLAFETPATVCEDFASILRGSSDYGRNDITVDASDSAVTIEVFCTDIRDYARSRRALEETMQEIHKRYL